MASETKELELFTAELGGPWPLAYGQHIVRGNVLIQHEFAHATYGAKTRVAFIGLAEGECDGLDRLWINRKRVDPTDTTFVHFHPGTEGELGHGLTPDSNGGDQRVDNFWTYLPANMKRQTFSGLCYVALLIPPDTGAPGPDLEVVMHLRGKKVRIFDNTGTLTAYQYSTNPWWWYLDFIIRTYLKRDATANEALTANEKARINFQAFVDAAADADTMIGTEKRFTGGLAWARPLSCQAVLEQVRNFARGYARDVDGQIAVYTDKARVSTFTLTHDHIEPRSLKPSKPLRGEANRFIGVFRDTGLAPVAEIETAANSGLVRNANVVTVKTKAAHSVNKDQYIDIVNPTDVGFAITDAKVLSVVDSLRFTIAQAGANVTSGDGTVGMEENKFRDASWPIDHEQHQLAVGPRGPGLSTMPKRTDLQIDFGNTSYSQVQRILKYIKVRTLGLDAVPYKAPWSIELLASYYAVDATDRVLAAQLAGDLITLDRSVSEELQGDYEILSSKVTLPAEGARRGPMITLQLRQYISASFTDTPDGIPEYNSPVPLDGLITVGGPANGSYRPTADPLTATDAGTTATVNFAANWQMQCQGLSPNPVYNSASIVGLPFGTLEYCYVDDPDRKGGAAGVGSDPVKENVLQRAGWMFVGSIVTPNDGGADTVGNGDGGAGAQIGRFSTLRPANYLMTGAPAWTTPGNAVDADDNSYADVVTGGVAVTFEAYNFPAPLGGAAVLLLKIKHQVVAIGGGNVLVDYSLDGGVNWINARTRAAADGAPVTTSVGLPVTQDVTQVRARTTVPASDSGSGALNAGTAADDASTGTVAWTNPTNAQGAVNGTFAVATNPTPGTTSFSHYLKLTNFGFALPVGAAVHGIKVDVTRKADYVAGPPASDQEIVYQNAVLTVKGGVIGGTNKGSSTSGTQITDTAAATVSYGSDTDLWGQTWAYTDINAATFGVALGAKMTVGSAAGSAAESVDAVAITVYYGVGGVSCEVKLYANKIEALV